MTSDLKQIKTEGGAFLGYEVVATRIQTSAKDELILAAADLPALRRVVADLDLVERFGPIDFDLVLPARLMRP